MSRRHWRLTLRQIREILRQREILGLSFEKISESCRISKTAVRKCVERARSCGINHAISLGLDEGELERKLYRAAALSSANEGRRLELCDWQEIDFELKRKGVTKRLLWEEKWTAGMFVLSYSQFCRFYSEWKKSQRLSLRFDHKGGERLFVDFAGATLKIHDPLKPGVWREAQVFVASWGASSYTFATVVESQDLPSWISCHVKAFEFFGCTPEIIVTDNLKSGVKTSSRYDPEVNPTYQALAEHYNLTVLPTRVRKPRDKGSVESAVGLVTRWILAALRHRKFFSIEEANAAVRELLTRLNEKKFQKKPFSRKDLFEKIDLLAAKALPESAFELAVISKQRVNIDYHIVCDDHYYSVPFRFRQKEVTIKQTSTAISIFYGNERIALHRRSYEKWRYTTLPEHRPPEHGVIAGWPMERIFAWARREIGESAEKLCEQMFLSRHVPEHGYRAWLGISRLGRTYGKDRTEEACKKALELKSHSYQTVKKLLLMMIASPREKEAQSEHIGTHENIRGGSFFGEQFRKGLEFDDNDITHCDNPGSADEAETFRHDPGTRAPGGSAEILQ